MEKKENKLFDVEINGIEKLEEVMEETIENIDVINNNDKKELQLKNSVFVEGGKYNPSFRNDEVSVIDLEVCKFPTTVAMWNEILGQDIDSPRKVPITNVEYYDALEFCNKLSEKYGLKPVYKLDGKYIMILEIDGEEVHPDEADFSKTEGFRLPTEVEWEWFARGGKVAQEENTFNYRYSGSDNVDEVAVYKGGYGERKIKSVGTKKNNQLGLCDCSGNVWEWCYDTWEEKVYTENGFIYDESEGKHVLRGGSWYNDTSDCTVFVRLYDGAGHANGGDYGFRVVRTL